MSDTKLSSKIKEVCSGLQKRDGITWDWLKQNTYFPEWLRDAQDMERYIKLLEEKA